MKKSNFILGTVMLLINLATFGQTATDKIIFLTEPYLTYLSKINSDQPNAERIYKEAVQTPIIGNYFQKSEYAEIVNESFAPHIKNTAALKGSIDKILSNKQTIEAKITNALKACSKQIPNDGLTVYVIPVNSDNRNIIEAMSGIMGLTAGSKQIILTVEPGIIGWENMLEYAVAHEYNHAYWTAKNFGKSAKWTLLDYLVFEGKGDYFAHLLFPNVVAPWTKALTSEQQTALWNKIKPNLQSEDVNYQLEVLFGSNNFPVWGGYSIGYDMVLTALTAQQLKVGDWVNWSSDKILANSKYR